MKCLPSLGLLFLMTSLAASGCSHSTTNSPSTTQIAVAIRPDAATMAPGQSVSFSATVSGSPDTAVVWSMMEGSAGGTVSTEGLYTAPSATGVYHVVATSHLDAAKFATAVVTVTADATVLDGGTHVSRDSNGWTVVTSSTDTRVIHVSSSTGSDTNDGGEGTPLKTIAAGVKLLRNGYPDWLLLKAGDAWNESFRTVGGRSADEPILLSSYGSGPRPQIQPPTNPAVGATGTHGKTPHVYLIGLDFYDPTRDPSSASFKDGVPGVPAIDWTAGGDDILVEDCSFKFLSGGLNIQGYDMPILDKVQIRRNTISDIYTNGGHAQGAYLKQVTNVLIEDNTFDHNCWIVDPKVAPNSYNGPNVFNHHIYMEGSFSGVVIRGNLFLRDSSMSLKIVNYTPQANLSSDLVVENNLFFEGEVGISASYGGPAGGISSGSSSTGFTIQNNVFLQINRDNPTQRGLGWGIEIVSLANSVISNNIFSDFSFTDGSYAVALTGYNDADISSGLTVEGNLAYRIHDQGLIVAPRAGWSNIKVTNNTIQDPDLGAAMVSQKGPFTSVSYSGNTYSASNPSNFALIAPTIGGTSVPVTYDQWVSQSGETGSQVETITYPDPGRNLDTYVTTMINSAWTLSDFYVAIRAQSRLNWHPEYMAAAINDYIRGGFGLPALQQAAPGSPTR